MVALYFDHIGAEIFINGKKAYVFDAENPGLWANACGKCWIEYICTASDSDTLEIVLKNPHKFGNPNAVNKFLNSMYMYSGALFENFMERQGAAERTVGLVLLIASIAVTGCAIFSSMLRLEQSKMMWLTGLSLLFAGGHFMLGARNVSLWSEAIALNTYGLEICMMLSTFFMICMVVECLSEETKKIGQITAAASGFVVGTVFFICLVGDRLIYDMSLYWAVCHVG